MVPVYTRSSISFYDTSLLTFYLCKKLSQHVELCFQDDSLEKLNKLLDACRGLGVETNPMVIDGLGIIPLFSWYHEVIGLLVFIMHHFLSVFSYYSIHDAFRRCLIMHLFVDTPSCIAEL